MNVLVPITEVAEVDDEFELDGLRIDGRYLDYDLNEWDSYALESAVQLAEAGDDAEVVAVTIGPERTEETVRMALAKGADRAIRVWDDAVAERDLLDAGSKAAMLAAVAAEEEPELILTGVQASDDAFAATGVALAERLGFEWAAVVNALDLDREAGVARVHRELEGGLEEVTEVELPAVLTVQTGINEPRYASLRGIRAAGSKPLDSYGLEDIGLDAGVLESPLEWTSTYVPESEGETALFEGKPEETAGDLAAVLRDRGVGQ